LVRLQNQMIKSLHLEMQNLLMKIYKNSLVLSLQRVHGGKHLIL